MFPKSIAAVLLVMLLLAACNSASNPQAIADPQGPGEAKFTSLCASCHGIDGSGSNLAPAVIGRSAEELIEQVRNPVGDMPGFSSSLISDEDLELIAQFVVSLGSGEEEAHEAIKPSEEQEVHLVAALEALEDPEMDSEGAIGHLQQALALASGEAAEEYAELIEAIEDDKAGNAIHELEEMLGAMEH